MKHNLTCTYENIGLRPLSATDIEALREWRNDTVYTRYLNTVPHITEEMQSVWYEKYLADEDNYTWAVIDATPKAGTTRTTSPADGAIGDTITGYTGRILGSVSLYDFTGDSCEYGKILIDPSLSGRGIGTKAERLALHIGFASLGMKRIHTYIHIANAAAIRKSKKNGFAETDEPPHSASAGSYIDHLHMLIEKKDFIQTR